MSIKDLSSARAGKNFTRNFFTENYTKKEPHVTRTIVQNIDLERIRPQRAGIIIYTVVNGTIYLGLGLDSRSHDLTDFGGGVIYKKDKNAVHGALREFREETLEIFEPIRPQEIRYSLAIYDSSNLIIFVNMEVDPLLTSLCFNNKYNQTVSLAPITENYREPEVSSIVWLTLQQFRESIRTEGVLFSRVRKFLLKADEFLNLL